MKQYNHQVKNMSYLTKHTVSVEMPEKIQLTNLIHPDKDKLLMLYVGVAICSKQDNFEKKVGRDVADSKLKPVTFKPIKLVYDDLYNAVIKLVPITTHDELIQELTFKVFSGSNKVYLIGAEVK